MKIDIFGLAEQNHDFLETQYELLRSKYKEQDCSLHTIDEFTELVRDEWTVSINMDPIALISFLISGEYKTTYKVMEERAEELMSSGRYGKSDISVEEALRKRLKNYYRPRMVFENECEHGEIFKYGALNIGGLGPVKYGNLCVVLDRDQLADFSYLIFLREDSLKYVNEIEGIDAECLRTSSADREFVHLLVVLKHEREIESKPSCEWPSMVCCSDCYVEAITVEEIRNSYVCSVRIGKVHMDTYYDMLFRSFYSELPDFEKHLLGEIKNVFELLEQQGIDREVV